MKFPMPAERLSRATMLQLWVVASVVLLLAAPVFFGVIANRQAAFNIRVPEALNAPSQTDWFGTDSLGRSQWNRTLIGTSISLRTVAGAFVLALPLSLVLGAIAGTKVGRWQDQIISWFIALLHTIPFFLLVVAVTALVGPGTNLLLAREGGFIIQDNGVTALVGPGTNLLPWLVGAVIWAPAARLVRAETIRIMESRFVRASRAAGSSPRQVFTRCVFPLVAPPAAVCLFYLFPEIIGIDAILTFFGLGPKPPTPSLGGLIFEGVRRWDSAPWLAGCPCLLLMSLCLVIHFLADKIATQVNPSR